MKLVVFCLFAVCCSSLASTSANRTGKPMYKKKIEEVRRHLNIWRGRLQVGSSTFTFSQLRPCMVAVLIIKYNVLCFVSQHNEQMELSTPPRNIEDCCCLSAWQCFRANLNVQFNVTEIRNKQLYRGLHSHITEKGLCNSSDSGNAQSTCQDCASQPKENAREFFDRLENLMLKAITRLSMD
ncbi:interleukin-21 isoform X1 [Sebastes umbrosus]|uniref:interleukin-21 isoform X1 n=2 Tax=Sebastes umbrosus TaxID=72105 RepID=UPI00189E7FF7|nr:interleukin-21 isoform X1 [Sebastes umbrosus]